VRVVNGRDGLIATGVARTRPGIGAIWHGHAELREPKRVRVSGLDWRKFLISWSMEMLLAQPAGLPPPPMMLPLSSSSQVEQAAHAAHVVVAVAARLRWRCRAG